jgi:hypothetical protein
MAAGDRVGCEGSWLRAGYWRIREALQTHPVALELIIRQDDDGCDATFTTIKVRDDRSCDDDR